MTVGVIHFVSEMLRGTQMTAGIIHFMSEMLRGTHITVGVIHFVSEMLRGPHKTVRVIHFMPEMQRGHPTLGKIASLLSCKLTIAVEQICKPTCIYYSVNLQI